MFKTSNFLFAYFGQDIEDEAYTIQITSLSNNNPFCV